MEIFDAQGRRLYIYNFFQYESSSTFYSYEQIDKNSFEKEIKEAEILSEKYNSEIRNLFHEDRDILDEEYENVDKKYPYETRSGLERILTKFPSLKRMEYEISIFTGLL